MCQKLLIIIGNNFFWVSDIKFGPFSCKKIQKNTFQDSNFGPANNKKCYRNPFLGHFMNNILSLSWGGHFFLTQLENLRP